MLLYIYKMGVHWYFQFAVKTADNRDKMIKYCDGESRRNTKYGLAVWFGIVDHG